MSTGQGRDHFVVSVGIEEGAEGAAHVHGLSVPGVVSWGRSRDEALEAFPAALGAWLSTLVSLGQPAPPREQELEIAVDEWVETDAEVVAGQSTACFESDLRPLTRDDMEASLHLLGDLRGLLLARIRRARDGDLEAIPAGEWNVRRLVDELARAQWWTLSRLGASPLAEVPDRAVARLDTAMALVVQTFVEMPPEGRGQVMELDGEVWTPRKVLRRLLWLEWALGRSIRAALEARS